MIFINSKLNKCQANVMTKRKVLKNVNIHQKENVLLPKPVPCKAVMVTWIPLKPWQSLVITQGQLTQTHIVGKALYRSKDYILV